MKRKLEAVRKRSYRPLVPEGTQPHEGQQQFTHDDLIGNILNRFDVGWNVNQETISSRQMALSWKS